MILFPNCKINLGLRVMGKRADGYHNLETVFYPIALKDAAELTIAPKHHATQQFELNLSGLAIPGNASDNLCHRAFRLIKNDYPNIAPVRLHLLKAIPAGAGLGGGSSDGAHTLLLLNQVFALQLQAEQLRQYALQLGSDCPFFILNKPCIALGRGEHLDELTLHLESYYFVLVIPDLHISTSWAFGKIAAGGSTGAASLTAIISLPPDEWRHKLINDFEAPVFQEHQWLRSIRDQLYAAGAVYASLTGTGSAIYGMFHRHSDPDLRKLSEHYKVYHLKQNK